MSLPPTDLSAFPVSIIPSWQIRYRLLESLATFTDSIHSNSCFFFSFSVFEDSEMDERKTDNAKECTEPAEIKESREKFFSSFYDTVPCVKNESKIKEEQSKQEVKDRCRHVRAYYWAQYQTARTAASIVRKKKLAASQLWLLFQFIYILFLWHICGLWRSIF